MGACSRMPLLLALAVVLLLSAAGEFPMTVGGGHERVLARQLADDPAAERQYRSVVTGAAAGAVEDESKAYIVGRPLFKVPPSSPCRANSARC